MRYPVGRDTDNLDPDWYNAQGYGVKTTYGYHDGDDFNLKSGGDTDLGQPVYAIADGTVTSIHTHSTIPTFGKHVHIQHNGAWGVVYSHFAHLDSILVAVGDLVHEGQKIGTLGKSGTQYAHLHFAIKNQPTGIDNVPNTLEELKMWENPTQFIQKWRTMADMYKGYDLENKDSMRVAVDILVRVQNGEFVDKPKYDIDVKAAYDRGFADGRLSAPGTTVPDPAGWVENGLTIEKVDGNTKTIINYKKV